MHQTKVLILIAVLIFLVGFLLALVPVKIRFYYRWEKGEHSLTIRFCLLRDRLAFGTKFDFAKGSFAEKHGLFNIGSQAKCKPGTLQQFSQRLSYFKEYLVFSGEFMKRGVCRCLLWQTEVGFADYAMTGVATGLLWSGKGAIIGYLSQLLQGGIGDVQVDVTPFFGRDHWRTSLDCIFTAPLGHIIIVFGYYLLWSLKNIWRQKRGG